MGPALNHYQGINCWVNKTHTIRTTDTATLLPHHVLIPNPSIDDRIRSVSENLLSLLHNKKKPIGPFVKSSTKDAMLQLAKILRQDRTPQIPESKISEGTLEGNNKPSSMTSEGARLSKT